MGDQHAGPQLIEIAAGKALQWNVDFDRGLRSVKPGAQCEAVMKLGPQLVRWSQNCMVTASSANIFKLEAGQDRVFANAILLRLADTFRTGTNFMRVCILKVLMLEFKERGRIGETFSSDTSERALANRKVALRNNKSSSRAIRMSRSEDGLLTKKRIASHAEMVKRVKSVIDSGDPTSRALALRVLGCLADLGKDSVDVHNLVLQALQSPHHQEVSAAFFAMGCLSELSDDFAEQALEKTYEMINAMSTTPQMKVWAVRFFSKMGHSPALSLQAHEMGRRIMLRYPTSEIVTTMLIALTILAAESVVIMNSQVELLLNYLGSDPRMNVRAVALRSLGKLVSQAVHSTNITTEMFNRVLIVVQDIALPSTLHVLALQVIRKLIRHCVTSLGSESWLQLISWTELTAMRGDWRVVSKALSLLVEVACNLTRFRDRINYLKPSLELHEFSTRVCFLLCDQVSITAAVVLKPRDTEIDLVTKSQSVLVDEEDISLTGPDEKITFISVLLVKLMEGNPSVSWFTVDGIALLMETLAENWRQLKNLVHEYSRSTMVSCNVDRNGKNASLEPKYDNGIKHHEDSGSFHAVDVLIVMLIELGRCLAKCVSLQECKEKVVEDIHKRILLSSERLIETDVPPPVLCPVLEALMMATALHDSVTSVADTWAEKGSNVDRVGDRRKRESPEKIVSEGKRSRHVLKRVVSKLISGGNSWTAYKVGEKAARCGLWHLAQSSFSCLVEKASSEGCYFWLRSLSDLCTAESLLHETQRDVERSSSSNMDVERSAAGLSGDDGDTSQTDGAQESARFDDLRLQGFGKAAASSMPFLRSCISNLSAAVCNERMFEFQRWVSVLRLEMVECIAELVGLVASISSFDTDAGVIDLEDEGKDNSMKSLISALRASTEKAELLGSRLKKLSEEYDMVTISFMGIDPKSVGTLSKAALLCSLLTFCSVGVFCTQPTSFHPMPNSSINVGTAALDLYHRLEQIEGGGWDDLLCYAMQCGAGALSGMGTGGSFATGPRDIALLKLCKWAVDSVLNIQRQLSLLGAVRGTRLLGQIIHEVLNLPWVSPPFFFCTRPRAGVELFLVQAGTNAGESEDLLVAQGGTLALSVCMQIANAPIESYSYPKKLVCALSYQLTESSSQVDEGLYMGSRSGLIGNHAHHFDMFEKLISHSKPSIANCSMQSSIGRNQNNTLEANGERRDCIFSMTVDAKGQGFASCTVDVSAAPSGEYELFLSCICFDKGNKEWVLPVLSTRPKFRIT
ncbi:integrator complex subunit 7 [Marchantia polymorpha subsp. ruderalis]|uniref:Integrator complex subunit 7 n=2 Tax=Marchantia polymorpha TaxID=3197 RepID=A0A176VVY1_MARPO|nr:hypothetical protein AXG93_2622s1010 [Marchantia polymorpha subsp. ruderalis]PTQ26863.1 hypothetical protein MARPO_0306s0002 [Marchantia polymorpha]BBN06107.1 hypothetical protein Mp_3g18440 [Marchantia polymorpha subsp. ruderalis]|eukprot:PTQ26863.1 hypothetical protein MARPO_0306s0002 [Marchantia polymorpha]